MSTHIIDTKFGPAEVRTHRCTDGWIALLVGRHLVPYPPRLAGPPAMAEEEAVAQLEAAVREVVVTA